MESFFQFWGKAQPIAGRPNPTWHPLAYHSLDVAAVAQAVLHANARLLTNLAKLLGLPPQDASRIATLLCGLHDIGKFALRFQAKAPETYRQLFPGHDVEAWLDPYDHAAGGLRLFCAAPEQFHLPAGGSLRVWRRLFSAVTGHHGSPPETKAGGSLAVLRTEDYGSAGVEAALAFVQTLHNLLEIPDKLRISDRRKGRRASYLLAGLAVQADWVGSKQEWFPYTAPHLNLDAYWQEAQERAANALKRSGLLPSPPAASLAYRGDLISYKETPTPMQQRTETTPLPDGPSLFLIEDETGSGKTEAAVMLAFRLMLTGAADGLFVGLPTMATSDAMYARLQKAYRRLFALDAEPSLVLAHSARDMHEGFRSTVLPAGRIERGYSLQGGDSEETASALCAAWIADDRRKVFLADVGVGTVDQALLAVLPSRHQSLRLIGLSRKVLVVDEVHAYDPYMQGELQTLLEFQAALGGSAILLSATLPAGQRQALVRAFAQGARSEAKRDEEYSPAPDCPYPLMTTCSRTEVREIPVKPRPGHGRRLPVRFVRTVNTALDEVVQAAQLGRAVLYIRNTVDDALDAWRVLRERGVTATVFHARYAIADRQMIEREVVARFDRKSQPDARKKQVLVATQVVEQSLDLDFDVMVTDLAPIDLLIQRAGRLHRHRRKHRCSWSAPELVVVSPAPGDNAGEHWFRGLFPRAAYVYSNHARLWLTARVLEEQGAIESPGGLRGLLEAVYGNEVEQRVPDGLKANLYASEGRRKADRSEAHLNVLKLSAGYVRGGGVWDSDTRTSTRLMDQPQSTLRLARMRDGMIQPYAGADDPQRAWRMSEVNVSEHRVKAEQLPGDHAQACKHAKERWRSYDADKILVVLQKSGDGFVGQAANEDGSVTLRYHPAQGLAWSA